MKTFKQRTTACFDIVGTDQQLTLGPAVFDWNPAEGSSDEHAAKYLKSYLFKHDLSHGRPVALRWVTCGPVRD